MKKNNNPLKQVLFMFILLIICVIIAGCIIMFLSTSYVQVKQNTSAVFFAKPIDIKIDNLNINKESTEEDTILYEEDVKLNIMLTPEDKKTTKCTYDIYFSFDEVLNTNNQYHTTSEKEFTIQGKSEDIIIEERQINDYDATNRKMLIYSTFIQANDNRIKKNTWDFKIRFYKTLNDQSFHQNKTYSGKILVENVNCISKNDE